MGIIGRRGGQPPDLREQIEAAQRVGDLDEVRRLQAARIEQDPDDFWPWFEAGLTAKAQHDWVECARLSTEASRRIDTVDASEGFDASNPGAWNAGIALTAMGEWGQARKAWADYGIDTGEGDEEISMQWGTVPIRLNPDRPALALAKPPLDGEALATEVVWCERLSPAHVRVANVPTPETGHRFADVLLIDGVPAGQRRRGEAVVPVFDELAVLQSSGLATCQATLRADETALEVLADAAAARGMGVDDWSRMRIYCSECSHGLPDPEHEHEREQVHHDRPGRRVGLGGEPDALQGLLEQWTTAGRGRQVESFEVIWQ